MNADQIAALEGLAGRGLTDTEKSALEPLVAQRNDVAIAAAISAGRYSLQKTYIGSGTILATLKKCGSSGGMFLDQLAAIGEQNRDAYWAMDLIKQGRFDLGEQAAQNQVAELAQAMPEHAAGLQALAALARIPELIDLNSVSAALNKAEGRMVL